MNILEKIQSKMLEKGASNSAILNFERCYHTLINEGNNFIDEKSISPVCDLDLLSSEDNRNFDLELLKQTVVIKLNGGLGTNMGLQKAKSLIHIKEHTTFLDLILRQWQLINNKIGDHPCKLLLMNSFSTSDDTLEFLRSWSDTPIDNPESFELLQNLAPKINRNTYEPVEHSENKDLEFHPPGHGDIYTSLYGSGKLEELLNDGYRYAFISNADNLGATLHPGILKRLKEESIPFLMEVTERTQADKKGGHLAIQENKLVLRELAQCPKEDLKEFQNTSKHKYFNTNNLWINLQSLFDTMHKHGGILPLPVIINHKTLDPRNKESTPVIQLETAMGAAIQCFEGAQAICVPRSRFSPVKSTSDLLALRSDAYIETKNGSVQLCPSRNDIPPNIYLDEHYKFVDSLEGLGNPSLLKCDSLSISGKVRFSKDVIIKGEVSFNNPGEQPKWIASGTYMNENLTL